MQIQSLPASAGAAWLRDGWRLLRRQPIGLAAMVMLYTFVFVLLISVTIPFPYLRALLVGAAWPFATVGVMAAFREVAAARTPTPAVFMEPIRDHAARGALLRLGLVFAVLLMLLVFLSGGSGAAPPVGAEADAPTLDDVRPGSLLLFVLLYPLVMVIMWFAPLLAGWHGLGAAKAMFASAVACWRNKWALLIYAALMGCVILGIGALASAVFGSVTSEQVLAWVSVPIGIALGTFMQASFYRMYSAIFA